MQERDRELEAVARNIRAFEGALGAGATSLPEVLCGSVLAVADGSNQVGALGRLLADVLGGSLPAAEVGVFGDGAEQVVAALEGRVRARLVRAPRELGAEDGHGVILETARERHADLVALPVPFLADYRDLGADSLGAVVDVLLERLALPLLAVRDPARASGAPRTVLFVQDADARSLRAAAWALAASRGPLTVVVAVSEEARRAWEHLAGRRFALDDEALGEALALGTAPLVAALHRAARARGREARLRVAVEPLEEVLRAKNAEAALYACPQGPLARVVLRYASNPVLAVA